MRDFGTKSGVARSIHHFNFWSFDRQDLTQQVRACLVRCNSYYTVIGINITRNRINCNRTTITIHQFGSNT